MRGVTHRLDFHNGGSFCGKPGDTMPRHRAGTCEDCERVYDLVIDSEGPRNALDRGPLTPHEARALMRVRPQ